MSYHLRAVSSREVAVTVRPLKVDGPGTRRAGVGHQPAKPWRPKDTPVTPENTGYTRPVDLLLITSLQQRVQEVLQAVGHTAHHIAGVAILGKEEGELKIWVLLQLNLSSVAPRQLVGGVFCYCHHVVDELLQIWTQGARVRVPLMATRRAALSPVGCKAHLEHNGSWS